MLDAAGVLDTLDHDALDACEPLARTHALLFRYAVDADLAADDAHLDSLAAQVREASLALDFGSLCTRVALVDAIRASDGGDHAAAASLLANVDVEVGDLLAAELARPLQRAAAASGDTAGLQRAGELLAGCTSSARLVGIVRREHAAIERICNDGVIDDLLVVAGEWERRGMPIDAARALVAGAEAAARPTDRNRLAIAAATHAERAGLVRLREQADRFRSDATAAGSLPALADSPLFAGVDAHVRDQLLAAAVDIQRPAGTILHEPGDAVDMLWIVRSGNVRICSRTSDERRLTVELVDPGAPLGEHALLGQPRAGTLAECEGDVTLAAIPAKRVRDAVATCPRLGANLLQLAGERLERSRQLAERVAFWSVDRRLARCVLDLDERYGRPTIDGHRIVDRAFTQFQLAELVNARRETVGDFLKRMRGAGVIELRKRRIVVLDAAELQRIAGDAG